MGSERRQTVKVRKWRAQKGAEVRFFTSRAEALGWLGTRGVPTPFSIAVEDYELHHEHRPREDEDELDSDNWTGVRLYERVFALYGTEKPGEPISQVEDRLRAEASARRRWSYRQLSGHRCQKQPWTKMATFALPKTTSGFPGRSFRFFL